MLKTILLVEDSETDAILIKSSIHKILPESQVRAFHSGQQAMDYLSGSGEYSDREAHPLPDLALLDLKLPGINGFDVLRWIRSQPGLAHLVVVVLTCSDFPTDSIQAYNAGANSVLRKPASAADMPILIKSIIDYWSRG